jgi:hypothetical protein
MNIPAISGNSRDSSLYNCVSLAIKDMLSDWAYNELNIYQRIEAENMSVSIVKKGSTIPVAYLQFVFEPASVSLDVTGFESKAKAKASAPIEGGEENAVRRLMYEEKIKEAIQKSLAELKCETPAEPSMTPSLARLYEAIGGPDTWFKPKLRLDEGDESVESPAVKEVSPVKGGGGKNKVWAMRFEKKNGAWLDEAGGEYGFPAGDSIKIKSSLGVLHSAKLTKNSIDRPISHPSMLLVYPSHKVFRSVKDFFEASGNKPPSIWQSFLDEVFRQIEAEG